MCPSCPKAHLGRTLDISIQLIRNHYISKMVIL
jgi:hypothetical protein